MGSAEDGREVLVESVGRREGRRLGTGQVGLGERRTLVGCERSGGARVGDEDGGKEFRRGVC